MGVATSAAVLVATAFSLIVLVPALCQVTAGIDDSLDSRVLNAVNFSKYATNTTYVLRDASAFVENSSQFRFRFSAASLLSDHSLHYRLPLADVQQFLITVFANMLERLCMPIRSCLSVLYNLTIRMNFYKTLQDGKNLKVRQNLLNFGEYCYSQVTGIELAYFSEAHA